MRRLAIVIAILLAAAIIFGIVGALVPPTATRAASGPLDRSCMAHLRETKPWLTREQKLRRCRVRAHAASRVTTSQVNVAYLDWDIGNFAWLVKARFEYRRQRAFPWSPLRWTLIDNRCFVDYSIIVAITFRECRSRAKGDDIEALMHFEAAGKIFDWGLVTNGVTSSMWLDTADGSVHGPDMGG